jgi:hypothetical protein
MNNPDFQSFSLLMNSRTRIIFNDRRYLAAPKSAHAAQFSQNRNPVAAGRPSTVSTRVFCHFSIIDSSCNELEVLRSIIGGWFHQRCQETERTIFDPKIKWGSDNQFGDDMHKHRQRPGLAKETSSNSRIEPWEEIISVDYGKCVLPSRRSAMMQCWLI